MEMFDAIVLNVLHKCNGCKEGLSVLVEGVGSAGWFVLAPGTSAVEILFLK
jgi:hypothetical protein